MTTRPADDAESWRSKYLDALDAQEQLEQQSRNQYQLMRRALVQLSLLADGQDQELDLLLERIRLALRQEGEAPLDELFEELDQRIRALEGKREQFDRQVLSALTKLVNSLRSLSLSSGVKKELGHYLSRLPARSQKISLYPALLDQLADLHEQAVASLQQARPGFMQRLKGGGSDQAAAVSESLRAELSSVLQSLLTSINPEFVATDKVKEMSAQLKRGLALGEVPRFLEQTRDLVLQAWLAANQVFVSYLDNVNGELADIAQALGGAVATNNQREQASNDIQTALERECHSLANNVAEARDLQQLKTQVNSQLGQIRASLTQLRTAERENDGLTNQLNYLSERVKTMEQEAESNRLNLQKHRHMALHDPLTQLPNREAYAERVIHEVQRWQRYNHPLTLAICDIDHFKTINDNFGHQAGDRVLKVISRAIAKRLREVDFFGRYGGEEFVVLLPETNAEDALAALDKIRAAIAKTSFHYRDEPLPVTLCMGIAEFQPGDTAETVFDRADRALYAAKSGGRNQCRLA